MKRFIYICKLSLFPLLNQLESAVRPYERTSELVTSDDVTQTKTTNYKHCRITPHLLHFICFGQGTKQRNVQFCAIIITHKNVEMLEFHPECGSKNKTRKPSKIFGKMSRFDRRYNIVGCSLLCIDSWLHLSYIYVNCSMCSIDWCTFHVGFLFNLCAHCSVHCVHCTVFLVLISM